MNARPFGCDLLITLLDRSAGDPAGRVRSRDAGTAATIAMPPLRAGAHMLAAMGGIQMQPDVASYPSVIPWTCAFTDVSVHGPRGIVRIDDIVVADTLPAHDDGSDCRHLPDGQVSLTRGGTRRRLRRRTLSLLGVNPRNYYHWTLDGVGRLAAAAPDLLDSCRHVLVPQLTAAFQRESLALCGIKPEQLLEVATGDQLDVAELLIPWSMTGDSYPHPGLIPFFDRLADRAALPAAAGAKRLYLDRRGGGNRRLANEAEVIAALAPLGFVAVRPETQTLAEQIAMFRNAEVIVAPHGAALTNILFACRPGCRLIELQMDSYIHWIFRRLAAIRGVEYDCVIGRQRRAPADGRTIHGQSWTVSVIHVVAAAQRGLAAPQESGTA